MSLSEGDFLGDLAVFYRYSSFLSPTRSFSPTNSSFFQDNLAVGFGGFILSVSSIDSFTFPSFSKVNVNRKPPWRKTYKFSCFDTSSFFNLSGVSVKPLFLLSLNSTMSSLRKSLQELDLGINDEPVSLPLDLCGRAASQNRFSLIVTVVNPAKQNLRAIVGQMPRIWGVADACTGRVLGNGQALFIFKSEETLTMILNRGPWAFNDWMLSVHRWYPNISEDDMKIIPFWMQIKGIPLLYLSSDTAKYVGSKLAHVSTVDFDENAHRVEFVRVCVDWNMDIPLRFQKIFKFAENDNTVIKFRFERLRNFCSKCGSLKHEKKDCVISFNDDPVFPPNNDDNDGHDNDDNHQDDDDAPDHGSDNDTLQTIEPFGAIPGLNLHNKNKEFIITESDSTAIPSAFEDTELTAERVRYLYAKFAGKRVQGVSPQSDMKKGQNKRKRAEAEVFYQQCEASEDLAALNQIKKRERSESLGSCSEVHFDGGAGGPVPPSPP
ncbi:hypothetical protein CARUB_v10015455mg [Capsella rubella]|uniref:DUF4283 domain-containing protein n=1 Tax=Capsella rubella TaxID=81985 RepID=R0HQY8_9BRAS|nr:hypothetical protein CARUB_v10015455mg [Capsella rubella]